MTGIRTVEFIKKEVRGTFQTKLMLKANVGFVTEKRSYTSDSGQKKTSFKVKLYDNTGVIIAVVTDARHYSTFQTAKAVLISKHFA